MNRTRAEFLYWSRTAPQEGLYLGQLAWEFLRRNNEYRDLVAPYVAAAPRAVVLKEISAADRERVRSFGLAAAVNPSCPGWAFWPLYWHPDKVPMMATFKQILPPVETPKPAKEIFYYRPQL
ncbi:MAG: hypothetical protein K0R10_143, partial [Alphaproteobacteria bacterium]|nr:hypothetical protein [Alphaproteobacteria bacterium]